MSGQLAEETINYVTNPRVASTVGWSGWNSTDALSTDFIKVGDYSMKYIISSDGGDAGWGQGGTLNLTDTDVIVTTDAWTASAFIYVPSSNDGQTITALFMSTGGSDADQYESNSTTLIGGAWNYVPVTASVDSTDRDSVRGIWRMYGSSGDYFHLDAVQVEQKPYPTPYCDGDLGDGHEWYGTSDASWSTRGNQVLSYGVGSSGSTDAVINSSGGGFACRVAFPTMESGINNRIFRWWDAWNTESIYLNLETNGILAGIIYAGSAAQCYVYYSATDWSNHAWYNVAMTWEANDVRLYIEGDMVAQDTTAVMPTIASTVIHIGESTSAQPMNGWVDELAIFSYPPSAQQIRELHETIEESYTQTGWVHDSLWTTYIGTYFHAGVLALTGAFERTFAITRTFIGTLVMPGLHQFNVYYDKVFSGVIELVRSAERTVMYDMVVSGLIAFSGAFAKVPDIFKAILGQIRLAIGLTSTEQPLKSQIILGLTETDGSPLSGDVEVDAN